MKERTRVCFRGVYDAREEEVPGRCANLACDDGDGDGKGVIEDNGD